MINRPHHTMIFGLYTLFSIFLGIVCITVSNSFYIGLGCFFAIFLTFACGHLFWLGRDVTLKMTHVLYNVEDENNLYQEEVKNIRSMVTNVTDIIQTLMTNNENLQEQAVINQKKYDAQFSEFKTHFEKLTQPPLHTPLPDHDDGHRQNQMNIRSVNTAKPVYHRKNAPIDEDFLNLDDDNDFFNLAKPESIKPIKNVIPPKNLNTDEEFVTVDQKVADTYQHLLEKTQDDNFLETIDDYQTKDIRKQLQQKPDSAPFPPKELPKAFDLEDEFIDLATELPQKTSRNLNKNTEEFVKPSHDFIKNEEFNLQSQAQAQALPSFADLVPDTHLKQIVHRQSFLNQTNHIPSLNSLLNTAPEHKPAPTLEEELYESLASQHPTDSSNTTENTEDFETHDPQESIKTIRKALESNSLDLFIRPITDNRVREVKFFETYNYLRDGNNHYISPNKFIPLARQEGMGIAVDRLMLVRSVQVLRHIMQSISDASIFCNISVSSFLDDDFALELQDLLQEKLNIAQHLIFEFPQAQLEQLDSVGIEKMQHFIRIGVRFSIDNIQGVLPHLLELAQIGISFIKLRPHDFNNGIQCNDTTYKGSEIKKACQRAGIILCAAGIDGHEDLLTCVENQADLLQGNLLGEKERSDRLAL